MQSRMKYTIAEAFISLSTQKSVDKITVKDLVEVCNISRQTFYYHFQDIMEVVEWSMEQAFEDMLSLSLNAAEPQEAIRIFIAYSRERYPIMRKLFQSQKREQVERLIIRTMREYLKRTIYQKDLNLALSPSDMELALHFYTFGIAGVLLKYCAKDSLDEEKLADQLYRLLTGKMTDFPLK